MHLNISSVQIYVYDVCRHFKQYFCCVMTFIFIDEVKPVSEKKTHWPASSSIPGHGIIIELTTLAVIGTE